MNIEAFVFYLVLSLTIVDLALNSKKKSWLDFIFWSLVGGLPPHSAV